MSLGTAEETIMGMPVKEADPKMRESDFDGKNREAGWLKVCETDRLEAKFRLNRTLPFFEMEDIKESGKEKLNRNLDRIGSALKIPFKMKITAEKREDFFILARNVLQVNDQGRRKAVRELLVRMPGKPLVEHWDETGMVLLLTELYRAGSIRE